MFMKNIDPRGLSATAPGLYTCIIFPKIISSITALPIKAKFYVEPPWERGKKVHINGPGHITKMAATPIYGKKLQKTSTELIVL